MLTLADDITDEPKRDGSAVTVAGSFRRDDYPRIAFSSLAEFVRHYPDALVARIGE
jgi:hypothetical protein